MVETFVVNSRQVTYSFRFSLSFICTQTQNALARQVHTLTLTLTHTHLNKLVGLLPIQPVGHTEGVRSVCLVEIAQQFGKLSVDIILTVREFQALQTARKNMCNIKSY